MPEDNENIRFPFTATQMIRCEECLRANPPTRVNCLYCAATLPLAESTAHLRKPSLRQPEKHEQGYNIIILPHQQIDPSAIASWLKLSDEDLERIVSRQTALPIARTASEEEAKLVCDRLKDLNVQVVSLSDEQLGTSVTRIRAMYFDDEQVEVTTSVDGNVSQFNWSDVLLIVPGRLVTRKMEVKERKSRKAEKDIIDTSQFFVDEAVIDFYIANSTQTWRIGASGFDFSCLGPQKTLLANENIATLKQVVVERASNAICDDAYYSLRQTLDPVWGLAQETHSKGWRRERPGKYSLGATTVNSNETQFTRYSRLKFYFRVER